MHTLRPSALRPAAKAVDRPLRCFAAPAAGSRQVVGNAASGWSTRVPLPPGELCCTYLAALDSAMKSIWTGQEWEITMLHDGACPLCEREVSIRCFAHMR